MLSPALATFALSLVMLAASSALAQAPAEVVDERLTRQEIEIADLFAQPERVQGLVVNRSDATLRGVTLLVQYSWLWTDERNPGEDVMSFAALTSVAGDIPPGGSAGFAYTPDRVLPSRTDGYYKIDVSVRGFRKVRTQTVPATP